MPQTSDARDAGRVLPAREWIALALLFVLRELNEVALTIAPTGTCLVDRPVFQRVK